MTVASPLRKEKFQKEESILIDYSRTAPASSCSLPFHKNFRSGMPSVLSRGHPIHQKTRAPRLESKVCFKATPKIGPERNLEELPWILFRTVGITLILEFTVIACLPRGTGLPSYSIRASVRGMDYFNKFPTYQGRLAYNCFFSLLSSHQLFFFFRSSRNIANIPGS